MFQPSKIGLTVAAVMIALVAGAGDADAKKKKKYSAPRCVATVEGAASSTGILGMGTAKARVDAQSNWQAAAASIHGARYSNFYNAQGVRWDCKKGAILLAKCVVTAKPCRY